MKTVILAGGFGTRISEESHLRPKPMIEIGEHPILWHIMKLYTHYGITEFLVCLGYKGYIIKEYFANYFLHTSDVTFHLQNNNMEVHRRSSDPWKVTLIDTGERTNTGGRLKRMKAFLGQETFCMTYGDGLSDVNIKRLIQHHSQEGKLATVTAIRPTGRFGAIEVKGSHVQKFQEKPSATGSWINGGFFVLEPKVLDYIEGDSTVWEDEPMRQLVKHGQLSAYIHNGFWQPMDTLREKKLLDEMWQSNEAPWKHWS